MKLLTQRWHITGAPWSDGNHVTAGAEDPHAGTFVLSIENDDFDLSERVDICDHIVRLHNEHLASGQRLRELDLALTDEERADCGLLSELDDSHGATMATGAPHDTAAPHSNSSDADTGGTLPPVRGSGFAGAGRGDAARAHEDGVCVPATGTEGRARAGMRAVDRTAPVPEEVAALLPRIDAAIERITTGRAPMRVPAEDTDPDLVLADCKRLLASTHGVSASGAQTFSRQTPMEGNEG